jgi:F0F1-type ATP synthase assembly protein I
MHPECTATAGGMPLPYEDQKRRMENVSNAHDDRNHAREVMIHNERVKLTADFLAKVGVILVFAGIIPLFLQGTSNFTVWWLIGGLVLGFGCNVFALAYIGRMR